MKILAREGDNATILKGFPGEASPSESFNALPGNKVDLSPDGKQFAVLTIKSIKIYDCETEEQVGGVPLSGCIAIAWSPSGSIMQTFERPDKDKGNTQKNLKLWDIATGEVLLELFQKSFNRDTWPSIQLSAEEDLAFHAAPNAVNVYNPRDFPAGILRKLHLKGLGGFAVSPAGGPHLAAYVPEMKGSPGFVAIYDHSQLIKGGDPPPPICRRSFFRANQVKLTWSSIGYGLLAEASSDTSADNSSYYGDTKLHFLSSARGVSDCMVALKEGPVHCATWAPDGTMFVVVAGHMPAQSIIFDDKCKKVADLGTGAHNLATFNKWGRFLALAGFGNLPGDLAVHERKAGGKWNQLTTTRVTNGVTMEWAPDGRHLMTATLAPRLRVDNALYVFRHDGVLVSEKKFKELLQAVWLPTPSETFDDRPSSPRSSAKAAAATATAGGAAIKQPPPKSTGYVPPSRRGAAATAVPGAPLDFGAAYDRHARASKTSNAAAAGRTVLQGNSPSAGGGAASKNAAKRARKKAASAADSTTDCADVEGVTSAVADISTAASQKQPSVGQMSQPSQTAAEGGDTAKRLRNLQKKLRQVQELKDKKLKTLDADQKSKLASEESLLREIQSLSGQS